MSECCHALPRWDLGMTIHLSYTLDALNEYTFQSSLDVCLGQRGSYTYLYYLKMQPWHLLYIKQTWLLGR